MKNIIYIGSLLLIFALSGCEGDLETEGVSRTTYFANFEFEGEEVEYTTPGAFTDPGVIATEDGAMLEHTTSISGLYTGYSDSDVAVMDIYSFTYTAINSDGYPGSAVRTVYAMNPNEDMTVGLEGVYTASTVRNDGSTSSDIEVWISKTGTNTYTLSHASGGFYSEGFGYGDGYRAGGATVTINDLASNDFTTTQGLYPAWGNTITIQNFDVNAGTNTITYDAISDFASGRTWVVTLVQTP
ncbi:MAG: hypothetical protein R8N23_16680 [Reichenbachiella sp.]|uniref:hypothetical protein n=1 Tax=Reichenbachiella sp. TaxID=2184521 RepID=UPI002966EB9C|nr:hypothetical protein [Reichenbachiella sp.]MDW3211509.1 hypothetical protein [Reichenbachiella sp.]